MSPPPAPVLALWIDSGDWDHLCEWMRQGHLPNLRRLRQAGFAARLQGLDHSLAEIIQSVAITGCRPETSHYWGTHRFHPSDYTLSNGGPYTYSHRPPYFALGPEYRVGVIDFPQFNFHPDIHGWQLRNWGCHSAMTPSDSQPPELHDSLIQEFGTNPLQTTFWATLQDPASLQRLLQALHDSLRLRFHLIESTLSRQPWNLLLHCIPEIHKANHYLVPNADSLDALGRDDPWKPLRELHIALDQHLGRLWDRLAGRWNVALYSLEGIETHSDEIHNTLLLGEWLLRRATSGPGAFLFRDPPERQFNNWVEAAVRLRRPESAHPWIGKLRRRFPLRDAITWERRLGLPPCLPEPDYKNLHCSYQPVTWLQPYWPHMDAFALPSFSDGFIRLNVRGREARGRIRPRRFRAVCDHITAALHQLTETPGGKPAVARVVRTRDDPMDTGTERPLADLIVQWNAPTLNEFTCPRWGRIGPAPSLRAGTHSHRGFFVASGPAVAPDPMEHSGHVLDIAPTLLHLSRARPPLPLDGQSLLPAPCPSC